MLSSVEESGVWFMEVEAPSLPSWTGLSMEEVETPSLSPSSGLSLGVGVREEGREAARLMLGSRLRGVEGAELGDRGVLWPSLVLLLQGLQWASRTEEGLVGGQEAPVDPGPGASGGVVHGDAGLEVHPPGEGGR